MGVREAAERRRLHPKSFVMSEDDFQEDNRAAFVEKLHEFVDYGDKLLRDFDPSCN